MLKKVGDLLISLISKAYPISDRIFIVAFITAIAGDLYYNLGFATILKQRVSASQSDLLTFFSILFGFTLSSLSILIVMVEDETFKGFRKTHTNAKSMWDSYIGSLILLGVSSFGLLLSVLVNFPTVISKIGFYCFVFCSTLSFLKMFWNLVFIWLMVRFVKSTWEIEGQEETVKTAKEMVGQM